ncbi:aldose 1-epimerase family protein [Nocardiopsis sp. RSe5-2]|uniref:Aldose 1-epimerase family protein n=1 Tax=Nocardiopsis endophytica TaxID=3018445 RepID=A0ABT4UAP7_9ACTN|nr:aldose 1-epimerase family protein [Nocardiopsis endophytica]MDA2814018.1 aldose 1-epimerase family protein [Nocardiopsis endophytica]
MPLDIPHHRLTAGPYEAVVSELGAALRGVRHGGRDLLFDRSQTVPFPRYAGAVLAPWPNRIAGARYRFGGEDHALPVDEPERGTALHGLALWSRWRVEERAEDALTLAETLWPRPGYPFTLELRARYTLGPDGLTLTLTAANAGRGPAPAGLSAHPYFTAGGGVCDDWTLHLPCPEVLTVDERLIPTGRKPAADLGLDFTAPRPIGGAVIDHAFTGAAADPAPAAVLTGPDGRGVRVGWSAGCGWVQVYTLALPDGPDHRRSVAIEPMTCAPDAFNSGDGLAVLEPGERLSMAMTVAAVGGD